MGAIEIDGTITDQDQKEFPVLPEGKHKIRVKEIEFVRNDGKACQMAKVKMLANVPGGGEAVVSDNMLLHTDFEWKLAGFFRAIGLMTRGGQLRMQWSQAVGRSLYANVKTDEYTNKNGDKRKSNKIASYVDWPEGEEQPTTPATPAQAAPVATPDTDDDIPF